MSFSKLCVLPESPVIQAVLCSLLWTDFHLPFGGHEPIDYLSLFSRYFLKPSTIIKQALSCLQADKNIFWNIMKNYNNLLKVEWEDMEKKEKKKEKAGREEEFITWIMVFSQENRVASFTTKIFWMSTSF